MSIHKGHSFFLKLILKKFTRNKDKLSIIRDRKKKSEMKKNRNKGAKHAPYFILDKVCSAKLFFWVKGLNGTKDPICVKTTFEVKNVREKKCFKNHLKYFDFNFFGTNVKTLSDEKSSPLHISFPMQNYAPHTITQVSFLHFGEIICITYVYRQTKH